MRTDGSHAAHAVRCYSKHVRSFEKRHTHLLIDGSRLALVSIVMLTSIHRPLLIRGGLTLFAVASFATVVVLAHELLATVVAGGDRVASESVIADDPASSADASTSVERARGQIASLARRDGSAYSTAAVDWTGLTYDVALSDVDLLRSTTSADLELALMGINEPAAAAGWLSLGPESAQAANGGGMGSGAFARGSAGSGGGGGGGPTGAASGGSANPGSAGGASGFESRSSLPSTLAGLFESQVVPGQPSSNGGQSSGQAGSSFNASESNGGAQKSNGRAGGPSVAAQAAGDTVVTVPEPSTLMLAAVGLISLIASRSRRRASC